MPPSGRAPPSCPAMIMAGTGTRTVLLSNDTAKKIATTEACLHCDPEQKQPKYRRLSKHLVLTAIEIDPIRRKDYNLLDSKQRFPSEGRFLVGHSVDPQRLSISTQRITCRPPRSEIQSHSSGWCTDNELPTDPHFWRSESLYLAQEFKCRTSRPPRVVERSGSR